MHAAKRALVDALDTLLSSDTVQVGYNYPGDPGRVVVYAGGVRMTQADGVAEPGVVIVERVVVDIYVVCQAPGDDARATEAQAEKLGSQIIGYLRANPYLVVPSAPGGVSVVGIVQGVADQPVPTGVPEPAIDASLLLQIVCEGTI